MLGWMVQNCVISALLTAVVWAVCRWGRLGPVARHALWMLVLLKLLTPPVVAWPWAIHDPVIAVRAADGRPAGTMEMLKILLRGDDGVRPAGGPGVRTETADWPKPPEQPGQPTTVAPTEAAGTVLAADMGEHKSAGPAAWRWSGRRVLAAMIAGWLVGTMGYVLLQGVRIARMLRRMAGARRVMALEEEVSLVSRRLGMRPLRARVVAGLASPYVWSLAGPVLLWPAEMA